MSTAPIKITMRLEGLKELEDKLLKNLPIAVSAKALRGACMDAIRPIQLAAKQKVVKRSGALAASIGRASRVSKEKYGHAAEAGIKMNSKKGKAGRRWHWEEFGWKSVRWTRGKYKKTKKPVVQKKPAKRGTRKKALTPFLRPAFEEKSQEALNIFRTRLKERIDKALKNQNPGTPTIAPDE